MRNLKKNTENKSVIITIPAYFCINIYTLEVETQLVKYMKYSMCTRYLKNDYPFRWFQGSSKCFRFQKTDWRILICNNSKKLRLIILAEHLEDIPRLTFHNIKNKLKQTIYEYCRMRTFAFPLELRAHVTHSISITPLSFMHRLMLHTRGRYPVTQVSK